MTKGEQNLPAAKPGKKTKWTLGVQEARIGNVIQESMGIRCQSDDLVLERVNKGEEFASSLAALRKIKAAGAKSSVMILNGMGGRRHSEQHAVNSARLMNAAQPDYLSTLVLMLPV